MFWNKKNKCPITSNDKLWVHESLQWIEQTLNQKKEFSYITITPTKDNFKPKFEGNENDAYFILNKLKQIMQIKGNDITLHFYSEQNVEFSEGLSSTLSDKLDGSYQGTAGTYQNNNENEKIIGIEIGQLKNPQSLISTIAHELSHYILLSDSIQEDDENLTDLVAIYYGFGVFMLNSKFNFSQWQGSSHQGWSMNTTGYLPEPVIAYAMAYLSINNEEEIDLEKFLNKSGFKFYKKSVNYITNHEKQ